MPFIWMVYLIRYKMLEDGEEVLCDAPYMQLESEVIFFILISFTHSPHTYYERKQTYTVTIVTYHQCIPNINNLKVIYPL